MSDPAISKEGRRATGTSRHADIVIGVPSYNSARTVGRAMRAVQAGLAKYFPKFSAVIVNADGGSTDSTREAVLSATVDSSSLLMVSTPPADVHCLSSPYRGISGKGSAYRTIFQMADLLRAQACAVVDADLRSITPEWIDLLVRPVLHADFDLVAPYYHRHKYDGMITNGIVYPLTRALYGHCIRQPVGGDFGMSRRLIRRYLSRNDWEEDAACSGIDIWMTTIAVAEGFRTCQSFLGAKLPAASDPSLNLSDMLRQVLSSVFSLMSEYEAVWIPVHGSASVDLFGSPYDVGLDPIQVNVGRMLAKFRAGCADLGEVWKLAMEPATLSAVRRLDGAASAGRGQSFHFDDALWARVIYDFACAHHHRRLERGNLLRSLTPLYLARVASFVVETREMFAGEVERRIEGLCLAFENAKPYLEHRWRRPGAEAAGDLVSSPEEFNRRNQVEVTS